MSDEPFVPEGFTVPDGLTAAEFRLAPLGPQHNESDLRRLDGQHRPHPGDTGIRGAQLAARDVPG